MRTAYVSHRTGVGLVALGLLVSSFIPASLALAAPVDASSVDSAQKGTITVHKHERTGENGTEAGNGKEITGEGVSRLGDPINGVKFCAQKVNDVDLKTNAGWKTVAELNGNVESAKGKGLGQKVEQTVQNGTATFSNLELGLYLITECDVTGATKGGQKVTVVPTQPFLVTVPLTDPDTRNSWMYKIHVYPKNSLSGISKTTEDKKISVGEKATFTLTAKVPTPENGKQLNKFVVMDVWRDADKLQYMGAPDDLAVTVEGAEVTLEKTTDYTIGKRDASASASGYVTVKFTPAGLKKLSDAAATKSIAVKMVVKLKVTAMPTNNGVAKNWPFLTPSTEYSDEPPNDPEHPTPPTPGTPPPPVTPPPPIAGPPVEIKLGKVVIKKFKTGDTQKTQLAGAKFKLYYCDDKDNAISVAGKDEWITEASKDLEISGIQVSNFYNGTTQNTKLQYCLVETQAPEGYEKLAEPIKFYVDANGAAVATYNADVPNSPKNGGFNLPLTGSTALILVSLSGLVIISGGILVAWRRRQNA